MICNIVPAALKTSRLLGHCLFFALKFLQNDPLPVSANSISSFMGSYSSRHKSYF